MMKHRKMMKYGKYLLKITVSALLGFYGALFLSRSRIIPELNRNILILPAAAAAAGFFFQTGRREKTGACVFAFPFLFSQMIGRQLENSGQTGDNTLMLLLSAVFLTPAAACPVVWFLKHLPERPVRKQSRGLSDRRFFLITLSVLFLCYELVHLAYLPGIIEYDSGYQLFQSWNHTYSASNPVVHTLILGRFYLISESLLGDPTPGILLFCLCQVILVAGALSYGLLTLRRNGCPTALLVILTVFFALNPAIAILSVSCTKDVPFYALLVIQLLMIYNGFREPSRLSEKGYLLRLALVTVLTCLMRANLIAAMFLLLPLSLLGFREKSARRYLSAFLVVCVACAFAVNSLVIRLTDAEGTETREMFNVPIAQLSRAATVDPEVEKRMAEEGVCEPGLAYGTYLIDLAKWHFHIDGENLGRFLRIWAEYGFRYPKEYLDAFLMLNRGYWHIGDTTHARVYGDGPGYHLGILPSRTDVGIDTIRTSCRLPGLNRLYEWLYSENAYLKIPVLREILSPAAYVWLLLLCLIAAILRGRWELRGLIRVPLALFAAMMLGPCCIIRYALIFILFTPLCFGLLFTAPLTPARRHPRTRFRFRIHVPADRSAG